MGYVPKEDRYERMQYRRSGRSGLELPAISLGLWHNFGEDQPFETARAICRRAFDLGITHFDLANNYGPPPGSAEEAFGKILATDFVGYRDQLIISSKAGYRMWPGPYGEWGSRKYLLASLDQSLKRLGLDYVDIFYSHRVDPETPLEETMGALASAVHQGKALYVGLSSYNAEKSATASAILRDLGTPAIIHQPSYSMLNRWIEFEQTSRRAGSGRDWLHCLHAACARNADRQIPSRHPRGQPGGARQITASGVPQRKSARSYSGAERNRTASRTVFSADGPCLGVTGSAYDLSANRSQPAGTDRRLCESSRRPSFQPRRIRRNRSVRGR